ncbi:MAG: HlyD family secretion protein, partial [Gammaproteobacteria bacterium]|nr:HlyD family secretion protein [Gammaproteobacteria bacterium]
GSRAEELRAAEAALDAAQAVLAGEEKRLADLTVTATRSGLLDNLPWNLGERVTIGSPVAVILAEEAPFARVYIPEPYRVKIRVGDKLQMYLDGIDRILEGEVRWIANEPAFTPYYALNQQERSRLMYLAEVQLPASEAYLPNGLPVQIELP